MAVPSSPRWCNCAVHTDPEIEKIDQLEENLSPVNPEILKIRDLISSLELCHHKADKWIYNIVNAIGQGKTQKGLGARSPEQYHSAELIWQEVCDLLSGWCDGETGSTSERTIGNISSSKILEMLGERTPLKEWQVQRVIDKTRSLINWPEPLNDPSRQYQWILLGAGDYDLAFHDRCPGVYKENEDFWYKTVRTIIHDKVDGENADISLGLAIDMLWPCHWRFITNLQIVLEAIGGKLYPEKPFAACGRNLGLLPDREHVEKISKTLARFNNDEQGNDEIDNQLLKMLGEPTEEKRWLVASLDKTIRLQLDPPDEMRALAKLDGPAWIKE